MTTMSSIVSTVRSAVLNGVFSGTRSMPNRMSVIFMERLCIGGCVGCCRCDRRSACPSPTSSGVSGVTDTPLRSHARDLAVVVAIADAGGVVDHVGHAVVVPDHHHDVAGDVDEVADLQVAQHREPLLVIVGRR